MTPKSVPRRNPNPVQPSPPESNPLQTLESWLRGNPAPLPGTKPTVAVTLFVYSSVDPPTESSVTLYTYYGYAVLDATATPGLSVTAIQDASNVPWNTSFFTTDISWEAPDGPIEFTGTNFAGLPALAGAGVDGDVAVQATDGGEFLQFDWELSNVAINDGEELIPYFARLYMQMSAQYQVAPSKVKNVKAAAAGAR
jgi:hypothetical protein